MKAKDTLSETLRKTVALQAAIILIAAVIAHQIKGFEYMLALIYGGMVTMAGTWIHAWRLLKISMSDIDNGQMLVGAEVFKGAILRFVVMTGMLALGMGYFKLVPLAVLIGFVIAFFGYVFVRGYAPRSK